MLMVRHFRALNARNILYLQAELQIIEQQLPQLESFDARSESPEKMKYSKDYWSLMKSAAQEDHEQWVLIQKMKEKLKVYRGLFFFGPSKPFPSDLADIRNPQMMPCFSNLSRLVLRIHLDTIENSFRHGWNDLAWAIWHSSEQITITGRRIQSTSMIWWP